MRTFPESWTLSPPGKQYTPIDLHGIHLQWQAESEERRAKSEERERPFFLCDLSTGMFDLKK